MKKTRIRIRVGFWQRPNPTRVGFSPTPPTFPFPTVVGFLKPTHPTAVGFVSAPRWPQVSPFPTLVGTVKGVSPFPTQVGSTVMGVSSIPTLVGIVGVFTNPTRVGFVPAHRENFCQHGHNQSKATISPPTKSKSNQSFHFNSKHRYPTSLLQVLCILAMLTSTANSTAGNAGEATGANSVTDSSTDTEQTNQQPELARANIDRLNAIFRGDDVGTGDNEIHTSDNEIQRISLLHSNASIRTGSQVESNNQQMDLLLHALQLEQEQAEQDAEEQGAEEAEQGQWTYTAAPRRQIVIPLGDEYSFSSITGKWQGIRKRIDFNPCSWPVGPGGNKGKDSAKSMFMYCNAGVPYPDYVPEKESDFMLSITPIHFAMALFGDEMIGFQECMDSYEDDISNPRAWTQLKRDMATTAGDVLLQVLRERFGWNPMVLIKKQQLQKKYPMQQFEKKTSEKCFPVYCRHCIAADVHPCEALLCWCCLVHLFPNELRDETAENTMENNGPVKTYIRVELLFPHPTVCPNNKFSPIDPLNILAREDYVNVPFPIQQVVGHSMDTLMGNLFFGAHVDPGVGLPEGKGVKRITSALVEADTNKFGDDRSYISLPVENTKENSNAWTLMGDQLTAQKWPPIYLRWVFHYMIKLGNVREMCPFVCTWPKLPEVRTKEDPFESWAPEWAANESFHLVLRSPSVLLGGMFAGDPESLNFYKRVMFQELHRDDTSLFAESQKESSPFYQKGPEKRSILRRPTSCVATLFAKEKRTLVIHHPSNLKHILHGEIGIFDGACPHGGWTSHPNEVVLSEEDLSGGQTRRRVYNCALHGHIDSMVSEHRRDDGYLDKEGVFEVVGAYEPSEHAMRQEKVSKSVAAHHRKEDEVARDVHMMMDDPAQRILTNKTTPGVFKARVIAQSVCCTSTKDLEEGHSVNGKVVVPPIPKGTKAGPAMLAMAVGMLNRASQMKYPQTMNADGKDLCKRGAEALSGLYKEFNEKHGSKVIDTTHAAYKTDDEEDLRRKKPKLAKNKNLYDSSGKYILL